MIVVLDTNILVSTVLSKTGAIGTILTAWRARKIRVALSEEILEETRRVLSYTHIHKRHQWTTKQIAQYVNRLRTSVMITPGILSIDAVAADPTDNKFLSCAIEANANAVVTGDQHLLKLVSYKGIPIITPRQCIEQIS